MKYNDYHDLKEGLKDLPATWYPALIIEMATIAYERKVFVPGGASKLIKELEEKHDWKYGFKIKEKE